MLDDIIWIRIYTCIAAYMNVYLVACGGVRASGLKFCPSLRLLHGWACVFNLRMLVWAVDVGTDSFVLLIDMHFK